MSIPLFLNLYYSKFWNFFASRGIIDILRKNLFCQFSHAHVQYLNFLNILRANFFFFCSFEVRIERTILKLNIGRL